MSFFKSVKCSMKMQDTYCIYSFYTNTHTWKYSSPPLSMGDMFQDPQWMLETPDSTKPDTYYVFSYDNICSKIYVKVALLSKIRWPKQALWCRDIRTDNWDSYSVTNWPKVCAVWPSWTKGWFTSLAPQGFITLLRMARNLKLIVYFWNFPWNNFGP